MGKISLHRSRGCVRRSVATLGASAALLVGLAGCVSYSYVDEHNVQHVIGFNDVTSSADDVSPDNASNAVSVTSFGLTAYSGPSNDGGVTLGYSRQTFLYMPNNACVDLNTPGLCARQDRPMPGAKNLSRK